MAWCRQERCKIVELHEAHDEDFARVKSDRGRMPTTGPVARATRTKAQLRAKFDAIIKPVATAPGRALTIECPECEGHGVGCPCCNERGELFYIEWLRWKRSC